jgi:hypothetical protein
LADGVVKKEVKRLRMEGEILLKKAADFFARKTPGDTCLSTRRRRLSLFRGL